MAGRVLRAAEELGLSSGQHDRPPVYRDTYIRAQSLHFDPSAEQQYPEAAYRDTYLRAQPLPTDMDFHGQLSPPDQAPYCASDWHSDPRLQQTHHTSEFQAMQMRLEATEQRLRESERDRHDAEQAAGVAQAALLKEQQVRYELEEVLDARTGRREQALEEEQQMMGEWADAMSEQHEELEERFERAVKAYKQERAARCHLSEQVEELSLGSHCDACSCVYAVSAAYCQLVSLQPIDIANVRCSLSTRA